MNLKKCGLLFQVTGFTSGNASFRIKFPIRLELLRIRKIKLFLVRIRILECCLQDPYTTTPFLPAKTQKRPRKKRNQISNPILS